jgi:ABC-2 type transport system ATP-binding protein
MSAAIRCEGLTRRFDDLTAVDDLSLEVPEGELFGLVGPDGAGKTTTMRLLTGILTPSAGEAEVAGHDVRKQPERVKEQIGYMSQRFGLYADLTVSENIAFYADVYAVPRGERAKRTDRLLEFSGLAPFRRRLAGNLSGGMKQKLGLVCTLIHTPRVLFLDEPTNGVDPVSRREFWHILYELLREKVTVFVSTAYLDEAERCVRVGLMHKGKLLACDAPDEVKGMMCASILEVRAGDARRAAGVLREALGARSAGLFGDRVHVVAEDPDATSSRVKDLLSGAGLAVQELRRVAPSLEDVFISVLEEGGDDPCDES